MFRCNTRIASAFFLVFQPAGTVGSETLLKPVANVTYKVLTVPGWPYDEMTATVRVTIDSAGAVTAVSERPDIIEIVSVTPQ